MKYRCAGTLHSKTIENCGLGCTIEIPDGHKPNCGCLIGNLHAYWITVVPKQEDRWLTCEQEASA